MDLSEWIAEVPLWILFLLTTAMCWMAVEAGAWIAQGVLQRNWAKEPEAPVGSLVGSLLGLLAFILAFTFGLTASRYDLRRQLVLEESNAIATTYLRASLLPSPIASEARKLLREYVDLRLSVSPESISDAMQKSEMIHKQLWSLAQKLLQENIDSEIRSLFIDSLNEVIDLHQSRKTVGLQYRISGPVWLSVYVLTALSMLSIGYQIGMSGTRRLLGTPVMVAAFSLVILMIADLDRPFEGFLRVSQQPIADVQQMMLQDSP
jgi:hypothetical protein